MMSGALPAPAVHDYYARDYNAKSAEPPRNLFDRNRVKYICLVNFKNENLSLLQKNEDLALSYALLASCYTYVAERKFDIPQEQRMPLVERFRDNKKRFNSFFSLTKFKV